MLTIHNDISVDQQNYFVQCIFYCKVIQFDIEYMLPFYV